MQELPTTLPASWFCSIPLYQLERRAVFLKSWHLIGPVTRFHHAEEKVAYDLAQVKIYVEGSGSSEEKLESGSIKVCFEHDGSEVRSYITHSGLLFVTLSPETVSFGEFFPDIERLLSRVDFRKKPFRRSFSYEGHFNWKTMMDGYQECLHCQYNHPVFAKLYPPTFYAVNNFSHFSQHLTDPKKPDDGLFMFFFPICTLGVYGGGMSLWRACPTEDPCVTRMDLEFFHSGSDAEFEEYFKFIRQVQMEDYEICERAQLNLERGVYNDGVLNPASENGVAYYQQLVRTLVMTELKEEESSLAKGNAAHVSLST